MIYLTVSNCWAWKGWNKFHSKGAYTKNGPTAGTVILLLYLMVIGLIKITFCSLTFHMVFGIYEIPSLSYERFVQEHHTNGFDVIKVHLYKKWKSKGIRKSVRKKMYTQCPPFYFPPLASILYSLSLFVPCTFTCASLTLSLFNHYTMGVMQITPQIIIRIVRLLIRKVAQ